MRWEASTTVVTTHLSFSCNAKGGYEVGKGLYFLAAKEAKPPPAQQLYREAHSTPTNFKTQVSKNVLTVIKVVLSLPFLVL